MNPPLPGFSVWIWGPIMWDLLHAVAFVSDRDAAWDAGTVAAFFRAVQAVLPCRYCRDSCGPFMAEVLAERGDTFEGVAAGRRAAGFVFDVHNKVNDKLARQRWGDVKNALETYGMTVSLNSTAEASIVALLDKRPTMLCVHKRAVVNELEPVNIHATLLLMLALARRADIDTELMTPIRTVVHMVARLLERVPTVPARNTARSLVEALKVPTGAFSSALETVYLSFYDSKPQLEERLRLFMASACGAGTCK